MENLLEGEALQILREAWRAPGGAGKQKGAHALAWRSQVPTKQVPDLKACGSSRRGSEKPGTSVRARVVRVRRAKVIDEM